MLESMPRTRYVALPLESIARGAARSRRARPARRRRAPGPRTAGGAAFRGRRPWADAEALDEVGAGGRTIDPAAPSKRTHPRAVGGDAERGRQRRRSRHEPDAQVASLAAAERLRMCRAVDGVSVEPACPLRCCSDRCGGHRPGLVADVHIHREARVDGQRGDLEPVPLEPLGCAVDLERQRCGRRATAGDASRSIDDVDAIVAVDRDVGHAAPVPRRCRSIARAAIEAIEAAVHRVRHDQRPARRPPARSAPMSAPAIAAAPRAAAGSCRAAPTCRSRSGGSAAGRAPR